MTRLGMWGLTRPFRFAFWGGAWRQLGKVGLRRLSIVVLASTCAIPSIAADTYLTEKQRSGVIAVLERQLLNQKMLLSLGPANAYHPKGLEAYVRDNVEILEKNLAAAKSRKKISRQRYLKYSTDTATNGQKLSLLELLGYVAWHEKYEREQVELRHQPVERLCVFGKCSELPRRLGIPKPPPIRIMELKFSEGAPVRHSFRTLDLTSAKRYADAAMSARYPKLRFGYKIGPVTFTLKEKRGKLTELRQAVVDTQKEIASVTHRRSSSEQDIEKAVTELRRRIAAENQRLAPFAKAYSQAKERLNALSTAHRVRARTAVKARKRSSDNNRRHPRLLRQLRSKKHALANLTEQLQRTDRAEIKTRIESLKHEIQVLEADGSAQQDSAKVASKVLPKSKSEQVQQTEFQEHLLAAGRALEREKYFSQHNLSPTQGRIFAVGQTLEKHTRQLIKLQEQLISKKKKVAEYRGRDVKTIEAIETHNARFELTPGMQEKRQSIDSTILAALKARHDTEARLLEVQAEQREAVKQAEIAAKTLSTKSRHSYITQASAQWLAQSAMALKEGKSGGAPAALFAATFQIIVNLLDPPKFYDVKLDKKTNEVKSERFIKNDYGNEVANSYVNGSVSNITGLGTFGGTEHALQSKWGSKLFEKIVPRLEGRQNFLSQLQRASGLNATSRVKAALTGSGNIALGILVDQATEYGKAKISEFMTSDEFKAFIKAQANLAATVEQAVPLTVLLQSDDKLLSELRAAKQSLGKIDRVQENKAAVDLHSWQPEMTVRQNDRFDVRAGYYFNVVLPKRAKTDNARRRTPSDKTEYSLHVEGQKLKEASSTTRGSKVFVLSEAQARYIEDNVAREELHVELSLK